MRVLALVLLAVALGGCGSSSDRLGASGAPTNPFASNYPSVDPGSRPARGTRTGRAPFRPPADVPL